VTAQPSVAVQAVLTPPPLQAGRAAVTPPPVLTAPPVLTPPPPLQPGQPIVSAVPATALPPGVPVYRTPIYTLPYPTSAPAGYPYRYPVAPPPAQTGLPMWLRGLALALVLAVVAMMSAGGGLLSAVLLGYGNTTTASWHAAPPPDQARPPAANAPITAWTNWANRAATAEATAQGKALVAGDQAGFLAIADPTNPSLINNLKLRYANLRAMGVGVWTEIIGPLQSAGDKIWSADLTVNYCFGDSTCDQAQLDEATRWSVVDGRLMLSKLDPTATDDNGPRPWETDQLTVRTGQRVVVASTAVDAWRVAGAVRIADAAAAITDTFAKWEPPPSRYVIFFAGPNDWKRWYGRDEPDWAAAWSVPVAERVTEIVVRSDVVSQADLPVLLTHEMTHVTTLAGPRYGATQANWWLIEGIAEYASHLNVALRDYDGVDATVQYVRGQWNGDPAVAAPGQNASQVETGGKYGVAYLSVRRIAEKYGKEKMLDFWGQVVHDDQTLDAAAQSELGVSWATVKADCARYVKSQVASV
jgi:hypothetical protein